ncbi:hypothetical protein [Kluyvera sichuanensis]|uniref:hypothetical protein n=1 Tax=Kluyvera sichuanensis TaxID=2725494 RepID=UPI0039F61366
MKGFNVNTVLITIVMLISGCSTTSQYHGSSSSAVGTAWGDDVHSVVKGVSVERARQEPASIVLINYTAEYPSTDDTVYSIRIGNLEYAVRDDNFSSMPISRVYDSSRSKMKYIIHARTGSNYQLYVRNYSRHTNFEIVATVDGLDVLTGSAGSWRNKGYIVNAGGSLAIQGFRKNQQTEAAFVFSDSRDAYAAHSMQGDVSNVGVIGFAAFELQGRAAKLLPPCAAQAFPADNNGYAPPPCRK